MTKYQYDPLNKKNLEIVILKVVEIKGKIYFHKLQKFEKKKMWEMIVIIEVVKIKVYTYFLQNLRKKEKKKGKKNFTYKNLLFDYS